MPRGDPTRRHQPREPLDHIVALQLPCIVDGNSDGDNIGDPDDDPDFDGDQNGVYDGTELGMYLDTLGRPSFDYGEISRSDPGGVDNQIGYAGDVFNREQKCYTVRYRSYSVAQWHAVDGQGVPRASIAEGELSDGELAANRIGYAGYVFDAEHELYRVRYRSYLPIDGRWAQRDPMGYGDGVNVFSYALASPLVHADPSGLKIGIDPNLKNPGRQNFIDEIRDAIQSMCPGADVGPNGEIEVAAMDENKECEEPCNGSPPGCDILGDLVDSGNIIFLTPTKKRSQIAYGVNGNPTWIGLNDPGRPKRDRDGNIRPGHEEVWHEIIHAYRHDKGWVPNPHAIKPGSYDFSVEEFETILQNNELRKWYQECGDGGGGDPGLLDPSSHPSIRPIDKNRLRKRDRMPDHLIKFN